MSHLRPASSVQAKSACPTVTRVQGAKCRSTAPCTKPSRGNSTPSGKRLISGALRLDPISWMAAADRPIGRDCRLGAWCPDVPPLASLASPALCDERFVGNERARYVGDETPAARPADDHEPPSASGTPAPKLFE